MKFLLFPLVVFITTVSHAQTVEAGLSGGIVSYSLHNVAEGYAMDDYTFYQSSVKPAVASVKLLYLTKHYQLGLDVGYTKFSYKCMQYPNDPVGIMDFPIVKFTNTDVPLKLIANRRFTFKHFEVYGGVFAAYHIVKIARETVFPSYGNATTENKGRASGGLQAGATYFITKHIGFNAEVTGEYNNYPTGPLDKNGLSLPLTAGIRYRM